MIPTYPLASSIKFWRQPDFVDVAKIQFQLARIGRQA
jgi:hypothetical protein